MTERFSGTQNEASWENSNGYAIKLGESGNQGGILIVSFYPDSAHPYYHGFLSERGFGSVTIKTRNPDGELSERKYYVSKDRLSDKNWVVQNGVEDTVWKVYAYEGKDDAELRLEVPEGWVWGQDPDINGNHWEQ